MTCAERVAACLLAALAAPAAAPAGVVTFRTVPAIAGVRISSGGQTVRTDGTGSVSLTVRRTGPGYRDIEEPTVLPTRLPSGKECSARSPRSRWDSCSPAVRVYGAGCAASSRSSGGGRGRWCGDDPAASTISCRR
jgi:hypothetical protein